jgi:NADH:ubiquinone oxidoreductase subunit E
MWIDHCFIKKQFGIAAPTRLGVPPPITFPSIELKIMNFHSNQHRREIWKMERVQEDALETIYQGYLTNNDNIITVLQQIQDKFGFVPQESVSWFAAKTKIPPAKFYGVITFYSQFHLTPRGKNIVTVCSGTVCHVKGANRIINKLKDDLKLKGDSRTTKDMQFTLENVNCVGACSIAPVVMVNDKVYGKQSPDKMSKNIKLYKE